GLDRCLAIPKDVVDRSEPRIGILPVRDVIDSPEGALGNKSTSGQGQRLHPAVEVVEPDAIVQGQLTQRPLVLREESRFAYAQLLGKRTGELNKGDGGSSKEQVLQLLIGTAIGTMRTFQVRHAQLDRMRSCDIRHGKTKDRRPAVIAVGVVAKRDGGCRRRR